MSLNIERKYGQQISKTTAYNILARLSLVDAAEKKIIKEYKSFERDRPDGLLQVNLTRFNGVPILTMKTIIPEGSGLQDWRMEQTNNIVVG